MPSGCFYHSVELIAKITMTRAIGYKSSVTKAPNARSGGCAIGPRVVCGSDKCRELSNLEFELVIASHAFGRWTMRCMAAAGGRNMTVTEILVLHHVSHLGHESKLADICFVLNIEDTHVVTYALKKLANLDLVSSHRSGKEVFWSATEVGRILCERYRQMREALLIREFFGVAEKDVHIGDLARLLRSLSELYDQGARTAASISADLACA